MSLSSGIRWIVSGLVVGTAALVGAIVFWGFGALLVEQERGSLDALVGDRCERLAAAVHRLSNDVVLVSRLEGIGEIVRERERWGRGGAEEIAWKDSPVTGRSSWSTTATWTSRSLGAATATPVSTAS